MALLIAIIGWLSLFVLALVCLVLMTPVFVRVHLSTSPHLTFRIEVRALAGLAPRLTLAKGPPKGPVTTPEAKHSPKPARTKDRKNPLRMRGHGAAVKAFPFLIRGILHRVHLTKLHVDADFGLGDPSDTGLLCGMLMPLQYAVPMPPTVSMDLRPDFTKPALNGSLTAVVRVTLAALLIPVAQFAWRAYGPHG